MGASGEARAGQGAGSNHSNSAGPMAQSPGDIGRRDRGITENDGLGGLLDGMLDSFRGGGSGLWNGGELLNGDGVGSGVGGVGNNGLGSSLMG